ncbi:hypothetical protein KKF05_04135 [Patescibacteria group bacterium]|nr:hypothetical protein [Patescibacteria group bacterium]
MTNNGQKLIPVVVVGTGNVGRALIRQLAEHEALSVVGVSNSRQTAVSLSGYNQAELLAVAADGDVARLDSCLQHSAAVLALRLRLGFPVSPVILADVSTADLSEQHRLWLKMGFCVATANKQPVTGSMRLWNELLSYGPNRYRFECTCGAWLPVVSLLQDLRATGDQIIRIDAAPSGSLGYIMSACDGAEDGSGQCLTSAILTARELGFTEPDPRDDLSLKDMARKALILARLAGQKIELADIAIQSLVPPEMSSLSLPEFLDHLKRGSGFEALAARLVAVRGQSEAESTGQVLRCLVSVQSGSVQVGLQEVPANGSFGRLTGTTNTFHITTKRCATSRLAVYGPGAGAEVTAAGVLSDILRIAATLR